MHRCQVARGVLLLLLAAACQAQVPHVSQCNFCHKCLPDDAATSSSGNSNRRLAAAAAAAAGGEHDLSLTDSSTTGGFWSQQQKQQQGLEQQRHHSNHEALLQGAVSQEPGADTDPLQQQQQQQQQHRHHRQLLGLPRQLQQQQQQQLGKDGLPLPDLKIYPTRADIAAKQRLPNCTVCRGCTAQLGLLKAVTAFGQQFSVERGGSPEWIFTTHMPPDQGSGRAVVKVWCMPIDKRDEHFRINWQCQMSEEAINANRFLVAQEKVVRECGLQDVTVKTWVAPVNGIEPETGLHIWWHGLWQERAEGVSLNQLSYITRKTFVEDTIMDLLQTKLNRTRVLRSAMLDLLTSQCDRHGQNVFINERGQITLIDNLQAMQHHWQNCGADSVFLPGTQKNELVVFGGNLVQKRMNAKPKRSVNPMLVLDYRCHAPGGKIGTEYPPELAKCLNKFAAMTPAQIKEKYDFPYMRNAEALQSRAKDMMEKGFEWTLQRGRPLNTAPKRYKWHQPCCRLNVSNHQVACGHEWNVVPEFPVGDPVDGKDWKKTYPDPGTFIGGSQWT